MRRILSISAVIALLASLAPAHILMSCHRAKSTKTLCHRTGAMAHHCEMMQEEAPSTAESASNITALDAPARCPMNCCFQLGSGNGAAIASGQTGFLLHGSEYSFSFMQIVFARTGFSSHTDRGPPFA